VSGDERGRWLAPRRAAAERRQASAPPPYPPPQAGEGKGDKARAAPAWRGGWTVRLSAFRLLCLPEASLRECVSELNWETSRAARFGLLRPLVPWVWWLARLGRKRVARTLHVDRHPEVLVAKRRASKGDGPGASAASFEARKGAHLRMTGLGARRFACRHCRVLAAVPAGAMKKPGWPKKPSRAPDARLLLDRSRKRER